MTKIRVELKEKSNIYEEKESNKKKLHIKKIDQRSLNK